MQQPPRDYTRRYRHTSAASSGDDSQRQKRVFSRDQLPDETIHQPPGAMFILGGLGLLIGLFANVWQIFTSFSAFFSMFVSGKQYEHMKPLDKIGANPIIFAICLLIAVSFQMALLFLVFRINNDWKKNRAQGEKLGTNAKHTAVEVAQHIPLVLLWSVIGFIADTVGDYTFINIYTSDAFLLFMYGAALYASSTIMLTRSLEYFWAGIVASELWHRWKLHGQQQGHPQRPQGV
jgi:hypothetical protein